MRKNLTITCLLLTLLPGCNGAEPDPEQLTDYREKQLQKARQVEQVLTERVERIDGDISADIAGDDKPSPEP